MKDTIKRPVMRIGPPADSHGEVFADGCVTSAKSIPVTWDFDAPAMGWALLHPNGDAELMLTEEGRRLLQPANVECSIGYRVVREHMDGETRVLDEIEPITVGVWRRS